MKLPDALFNQVNLIKSQVTTSAAHLTILVTTVYSFRVHVTTSETFPIVFHTCPMEINRGTLDAILNPYVRQGTNCSAELVTDLSSAPLTECGSTWSELWTVHEISFICSLKQDFGLVSCPVKTYWGLLKLGEYNSHWKQSTIGSINSSSVNKVSNNIFKLG